MRRVDSTALTSCVTVQIALDTYILVFRQCFEIKKLIHQNFSPPFAAFAFTKEGYTLLQELFFRIESMVKSNHRFIANEGVLNQFKHRCAELFYKESSLGSAKLYQLADRAWLRAHQSLQVFIHDFTHLSFLHSTLQLTETVEQLKEIWREVLIHFRRDENVLFFLLRRRVELDYGTPFMTSIFQSLYPEGRDSLESFVIEAYAKRGFQQLIPEICAKCRDLPLW